MQNMKKSIVIYMIIGLSFLSVNFSLGEITTGSEGVKKAPKRIYINSARRVKKAPLEAKAPVETKKAVVASVKAAPKKEDGIENYLKVSEEDKEIQQVVELARRTEKKIDETLGKIDEVGVSIQALPQAKKSLALRLRSKLIEQTRILVQMREEISQSIVSLDPSLEVIFDNEFDARLIAQKLSKMEMTQLAHLMEEEMSQLSSQMNVISTELEGFTSNLRKDVDYIKTFDFSNN